MEFKRGDIIAYNDGIYVIVSEDYGNGSFTVVKDDALLGPHYSGLPQNGARVVGNLADYLPKEFKSTECDLRGILDVAKEKLLMVA